MSSSEGVTQSLNRLSCKEAKFTPNSADLLVQLRKAIDAETNLETIETAQLILNQIHRSLEDFTGDLYLASLQAKGRLAYLTKDGSVK